MSSISRAASVQVAPPNSTVIASTSEVNSSRGECPAGRDRFVAQGAPYNNDNDNFTPCSDAIDKFSLAMRTLAEQHRPSRMPFFRDLAALDPAAAKDPSFLGQIHLVYQAAMHATRAAVYYLPHLDSPALRKRKLQIFVDDDGLPGGDTHHYQLTRAFRNIGANCVLDDEAFAEPEELCRHLDGEAAQFVRLAKTLYSHSLGPWCAIEVMSVDWMRALADALSVHFPQFADEPYFAECFSEMVEERHAEESLSVTQMVLLDRIVEVARRQAAQRSSASA
jgi:hypothetical protein